MPDFHIFWRVVRPPSLLESQSTDGWEVNFISCSIFEETCLECQILGFTQGTLYYSFRTMGSRTLRQSTGQWGVMIATSSRCSVPFLQERMSYQGHSTTKKEASRPACWSMCNHASVPHIILKEVLSQVYVISNCSL